MNNLPLHLYAVLVPPMPTLNTSEPHSAVSRTKATHHTHQPFRKLRIRRLRRLQRRLTTRTHQLLRSCQCLTSSLACSAQNPSVYSTSRHDSTCKLRTRRTFRFRITFLRTIRFSYSLHAPLLSVISIMHTAVQ